MNTILCIFIAACVTLSFGAMVYTDKLCEKYSKYRNGLKITGKNLAKNFLKENGIENFNITSNGGDDYYDIVNKSINLSDMSYDKDTVTAIAISAHECGHVLQAKSGYLLLKIKYRYTYYVNAFIYISAVMLSLGYIAKLNAMMQIAIFLMTGALLFQFLTLPLEIDASLKALKYIKSQNIDKEEIKAIKLLLFSASISYFGNLFFNIVNMFKTTWTLKKRVIELGAVS